MIIVRCDLSNEACELWIAREKLSTQGRRTDLGTFVLKLPTWADYCQAIGVNKRIVNRWLGRIFSRQPDNTVIETPQLPSGQYSVLVQCIALTPYLAS